MLYVIKDGVRELDQWCNKLLQYGEAVSSVKQDDSPKVRFLNQTISWKFSIESIWWKSILSPFLLGGLQTLFVL